MNAERPGRRRGRGLFRTGLGLVLLAVLVISSSPFLGGAAPQSVWTGVDRVVAVGDLHGDYENFIKILKNKEVGLVDENLRWIAGKTHFVQTGDILDRGDDAKKILDLMRRLEAEAPKAGGMVHLLLGNHEELALIRRSFDRQGYVRLSQFLDFIPDTHRRTLENRARNRGVNPFQYWTSVLRDPDQQQIYFENFEERYGRWLVEHNVIIKINQTVFVHGGISLDDSKRPLDEINGLYRSEFNRFFWGADFRPRMVYAGSRTPLWNRDLAIQPEAEYAATVDEILANLGAGRIVVAHTPTLGEDLVTRFGGRVYIIDTGIMRRYTGGFLSALIMNDGDIHVWKGAHHD